MLNLFAAPHLSGGHTALQCIAVQQHSPLGGFSIFIEQVKAEMPQTARAHGWKCLNACLCGSVEQCVATSEVCSQGVLNTAAVLEQNGVGLAGSTAIRVVVPIREQCAEQAMLHMEERHVLVQHNLQTINRGVLGELKQLLEV